MRLLVALGLLTFSAVVLAASVSSSSSASGWLANPAIPVLAAVAVGLAAVDQFLYVRRKGSLPGPTAVPPFLGFLHRSLTPTFEGYIKQWNMGALSCTSVLHKFIVFATSNELSRKTFNTPEVFTPAGPASMRTVLCPENWVFLQGQEHVDYRKKLVPLFTRAALSAYLPLQQEAYKYNISKWLKDGEGGKEIEMMGRIRDLNMTTSLGVFCGMRYLPDNADVELSEAYRIITYAFQLVNIPFAIPGTAVYDAVCAREKIMHYLMIASERSHERYAKGEKAESLLDRWVEALEKERADWEAGGRKGKEPRKFTHREIALTVMTMIFASQDASTSSVVWSVQTLADHPHVLQRVREEQKALRPNNETLTYETMCKMEYTWRVVKELLRYRPPVTMMLYEAKQQTDLGGHPIDKGTLVVASVYPSLHDPKVFVNPEKFDPDRFLSDDPALQQNYMVWGHGPHACIGRDYAMSHLVAFIAYLSTTCDWEHIVTPDSQKIMIIATLYPADKCRIKIKPRAV